MAERGSLTFAFDADFSGFTRAADSAGAKLDALSTSRGRLGERHVAHAVPRVRRRRPAARCDHPSALSRSDG